MATNKHAVAAYLPTQLDGATATTPHLPDGKTVARRFLNYLAGGEVVAPHNDDSVPRLPNYLARDEVFAPHLPNDKGVAPRFPNYLAGREVLTPHLPDDDDFAPRLQNYLAGREVLAPLLKDDEFAPRLANYLAPHLLKDDEFAPRLANYLAPRLLDDDDVAPLLSADLDRDAGIYLPTELLQEILVRLPVSDIVRCQIVEKRWQNIVRGSSFGHAYALRRSPKPIFFYRRDFEPEPELAPCTPPVELQEMDLTACKTRQITGFAHVVPQPEDLEWESPFTIEGSCDGLLLISLARRLYVCNPSIRRWACVAPVHVNHGIAAFYSYSAPGEMEVQYWILHRKSNGDTMNYSIFSLNDSDVRQVASSSLHSGASSGNDLDVLWSKNGLRSYEDPPIRIGDKLYWRPQDAEKSKIIVFDIGAEFFNSIHSPRGNKGGQLLTVDGNVAMAATDVQNNGEIDLWVLKNKWTLCYKVALPQQEIDMRYSLLDRFGNTPVFVIQQDGGIHVLVQCLHHILQCKRNADVRERHSSPEEDAMPLLTHHTFCESSTGLPFLDLQDGDVDKEGDGHPFLFS